MIFFPPGKLFLSTLMFYVFLEASGLVMRFFWFVLFLPSTKKIPSPTRKAHERARFFFQLKRTNGTSERFPKHFFVKPANLHDCSCRKTQSSFEALNGSPAGGSVATSDPGQGLSEPLVVDGHL